MQSFKPFAKYTFLLILLFVLAACSGQAAPTATPAPEATSAPTEAAPTETMVTNAVTVADQELGAGNTVTIAEVVSDSPGWLVVHADADGSPGPVIGHAPVNAGDNTDVVVEIDPSMATETLYAMLHVDAGTAGEYEFPGADVPATDAEGNVVTPSFQLTGGMPVSNSVTVTDQELGEGNTVTIPVVVSDGPGWLVIHADADGSPGPVIGHAPVTAGANADVLVEIDPSMATETLYAMLHVDAGTVGEYEFPGADVPATDAEGNVVTPSFQLTGGMPVSNSVTVADQELGEGNTVTIAEVVSDGPGWLVVHADADGSPGPVIGHAPVNAGDNTDVVVEIDPSMATETLYAMLHVDAGTVGEYEFPGDDVPATDAEGNVVTPSFQLTGAMSEAPTVAVGGNDELGDFLVAANGMTLYIFTVDDPGTSNCYDDCATAWPPLLVKEGQTPTAGEGVTGELGTTTRDDGTVQVTYNDQPLYFYAPDQEPGDATGQNVGDVWFVVEP